MSTKILIVDDHPIVCEGLTQLISQEADLEVVGDARDAAAAMKKIQELKPDFVIADLSLEGKSGIELIAEIKASHPQIPVLALSMHGETVYMERALKAGARGYVTKNDATNVVIKAVRKVLKGGIYLNEEMASMVLESMFGGKQAEHIKTGVERLSAREFEVFRLIGQGFKNHEIAEVMSISVKTVHAHRENMKEKLQIKDSQKLFSYALQWVQESEKL